MADAGYRYVGGTGVADEIEADMFLRNDKGLEAEAKAGVEGRSAFYAGFVMYGKYRVKQGICGIIKSILNK